MSTPALWHKLILTTCGIGLLAFTHTADAETFRDQGRLFDTAGEVDLGTDFFSQSITAGISGGLAAIEIQINSFDVSRTEFSIYSGGNPVTTPPLISKTFDFPTLGLTNGDVFRWELPNPLLYFAEGEMFSFGFQAEVAGQRFAANDNSVWVEDYADGELFKNSTLSTENDDVAFITYVDTLNAVLEGRLETSPGSGVYQAYYDPKLDITWAANANINGKDTWDNQVAWAASLTIGGVGGWRLPSTDVNGDGIVVDCFGGGVSGCEDNEMGFLFWEEGITQSSPGPFSNLQANYWSGTEYIPGDIYGWGFDFTSLGEQFTDHKTDTYYSWAVHSGDVGAIPVPAAVWLFGSGLMGLVWVARRQKTAKLDGSYRGRFHMY